MKLAIVVGHNSAAKGARRVTDGVHEYDWNGELAELIQAHDPSRVKVFRRTSGGGYSREIDRVYSQVDAWGATLSAELHFNASGNASVSGGETLTSGTTNSRRFAQLVQDKSIAALGNRDRGLKVRSRFDRGGRSLWQGRAPAILTEPFFGSNASDCNRAEEAKDQLAEAIYRAALEYHGVTPVAAPPAPPIASVATPQPPTDWQSRATRAETTLHRIKAEIAEYEKG